MVGGADIERLESRPCDLIDFDRGDARDQRVLRLLRLRTEVRKLERELSLSGCLEAAPASFVDEVAFYALLSDHASDLISLHGSEGDFYFVSPNVTRLFGYAPSELMGENLYTLVHPADVATILDTHIAQARDDERRVRYRFRAKGGDYRWVETRSRAYRDQGGVAALICFTRDIEEEERALSKARAAEARLRDELTLLASTDGLTGVANRRAVEQALEREVARSQRASSPLTVCFFDLDHFKCINDTYGHETGDRVLVEVANALVAHVRQADWVGRWGGEEFVIMLPGEACDVGRDVAERVGRHVRALDLGLNRPLTLSAGVATLRPNEAAAQLVRRADAALYEAKRAGRDCVRLADARP